MKTCDLRHGDVLLFNHRSHVPLFARCIRLITGSKFTHCAVIIHTDMDEMLVLEQLHERQYSLLHYYQPDVGAEITVMRPRFYIPTTGVELRINHSGYNYWSLVDCLINHLMGNLTCGRWKRRAMLSRKKEGLRDCSQLVGWVLSMENWRELEPDDFCDRERKRFFYLGVLEF